MTGLILPPPNQIGAPERYTKWRTLQQEAILAAAESTKRFIVQGMATGCVAASTVIRISRGFPLLATKNLTIEREFRFQNNPRRNPNIRTYTTSMLSRSVLGRQRVNRVVFSGNRQTYRLLLCDGRELRATDDHQIATNVGWVELGAISGNIKVLCEGNKGGTPKAPKKMYKQVGGLIYHPFCDETVSSRDGRLHRVPYHRLVAEAKLSGVGVLDFISICKSDPVIAACMSFLDPADWVVHHTDNDHTNNHPDNLEVITQQEHCALHGKQGGYNHFANRIQEVQVRTVDKPGRDDTFDVVCCEPNHNFLANGIIVHNSGKSLVYVAQALLSAERTVILTSTKALQSQLLTDFAESGLIEIRGLNSYPCNEGKPTGRFGDMRREGLRADRGLPMMCDEAPCQAGAFCPQRDGGCTYYDAYRRATTSTSRLIVTNYAYWMSINKYGEGLGPFDLLVADEAHNAIDELGGFIGTELRPSEVEGVLPSSAKLLPVTASQKDWIRWAAQWHAEAVKALDIIRAAIKGNEKSGGTGGRLTLASMRKVRDLKRLQRKLSTISSMRGEWIIDHTEDHHRNPITKFDPVWPGEYAEGNLFLGIKKVVMVSATVRPKTALMLGIKKDELDFREYPSVFLKERRPVIYFPVGHMNYRSAAASRAAMSMGVDQIIARRLDRKAIIQTVSYQRAREVYQGSQYKGMMMMHDSDNTKEVIERFKASTKPVILVSPVLSTGYDFKYSEAEYQILVKVPFPVTTDKIVKARVVRDPEYKDYITMIALVQMAGRICRAEDDMGETFILDSDFGWWYYGTSGSGAGVRLSPNWFKESVKYQQVLGSPLPKLNRGAI